MDKLIIILVLAILGSLFVFKRLKNNKFRKPSKTQITDYYKNIDIEPVGCFEGVEDKFFLKDLNVYSSTKVYDSGIIISDTNLDTDMRNLIKQVMNNGYDVFAFEMLDKYDKGNYKNMNMKEIATLGKLAGYSYMSLYKLDEKSRGKIYLTYSPPLDYSLDYNYTDEQYKKALSKPNDFTLTPKLNNYTNELEKAPGKELSCGYPCLPGGKVQVFKDASGNERQYMCGSVAYPSIKTGTRFSVYKIKAITE